MQKGFFCLQKWLVFFAFSSQITPFLAFFVEFFFVVLRESPRIPGLSISPIADQHQAPGTLSRVPLALAEPLTRLLANGTTTQGARVGALWTASQFEPGKEPPPQGATRTPFRAWLELFPQTKEPLPGPGAKPGGRGAMKQALLAQERSGAERPLSRTT